MIIAKACVQCERFLRSARRHASRLGRNDNGGAEHRHDCIVITLRKPKQILRRAAFAAAQNDIAVVRATDRIM